MSLSDWISVANTAATLVAAVVAIVGARIAWIGITSVSIGTRSVSKQSQPIRPLPRNPRKEARANFKLVFLGCMLAVVSLLIFTFLQAQPQFGQNSADSFLRSYYQAVTQPAELRTEWETGLTDSFRNDLRNNWTAYQKWWHLWKHVTVDRVTPVAGNPAEFIAIITYRASNRDVTDTETVVLACRGLYNFVARLPMLGCPDSGIQIQSDITGTPSAR
jgi:hypothetical protein